MSKVINFNKFKVRKEVDKDILRKMDEDKENYFKLNDEEKKNYYLLKYIFDNYINEEKYIERVFNYILNNLNEDYLLEFLIRRKNQINLGDGIDIQHIMNDKSLDGENSVLELYLKIEFFKANIFSQFQKLPAKDYGLGFATFKYYYGYSDIIVESYAKSLIFDKVFNEEDLENYLHENYESYKKFLKENENLSHFIITYVGKKDGALAGYISKKENIIDKVLKILEKVKKDWEIYENKQKQRFLSNIQGEILKYILERVNNEEQIIRLQFVSIYILNSNIKILEKYYSKDQAKNIMQEWNNYNINETIVNSNEYLELKNYIEELLKENGLSKNVLKLVKNN